jgi:regulator of protease activity HflC (stomatin/prohibitin superfamily)
LATTNDVIEWTSEHSRQGASAESLFLTADEVLVETTAELQYQIADLATYHFRGPTTVDVLLRRQLEAVLRELSVRHPLDDWLTDRRAELEQRAQQTLAQRVAQLDVGVAVVDVQLLDVHPPVPVVADYRGVADALEEQEQRQNEASLHAARTLLGAMGEAAWHQWPATEPLTDERWRAFTSFDAHGQRLLSGAAAAHLEQAAAEAVIQQESAAGRAERIAQLSALHAADPQLTWPTLYWSLMTPALSQRPLFIVDPRAVGRQHWWWMDGGGRRSEVGGRNSEAREPPTLPPPQFRPTSDF